MALSASAIEVPLAVQRAREHQNRRYEAYLQYGLDDTQINDQMEIEEEEAEMDTCWSWCVCIGALLVNAFLVGIHHAYGVIFVAIRKEYDMSFELAAGLGSLSYGISSLLSPLSGLVYHRIGHRCCATIGTFISVGGLIGSSFARTTPELFFAYAIMFGLGTSLVYTPSVVVCNAYFDRHIGVATGIQISGTMIGGIILPPVCQILVTSVGYRAMMRVLAGIACLGFVGGSTFTGKQDIPPISPDATTEQSATRRYLANARATLKDPPYVLWLFVMITVHLGTLTPIVHLVARGIDIGLGAGEASAMVSVFSVSSALCRIVFGRVMDHPRVSSPRLMMQLALGIMGLAMLLSPGAVNMPLMLAFALVYGSAEGMYVVLMPLYTLKLMGQKGAGVAWSLIIGMVALPWIAGPYLAGLLRSMLGNYDVAYVLSGLFITMGAIMLFSMPICLKKRPQDQPPVEDGGEEESMLMTVQGVDLQHSGLGPIYGYISIQDMPPSYRQQIRFRPGKTQQLRQGLQQQMPSTAQTISNLEIAPAHARAAPDHQRKPSSRSQEMVAHPAPFEYDSLAALRRKLAQPVPATALQAATAGTSVSESVPQVAARSEPEAAVGSSGAAALGPAPVVPAPPEQLPPGYEALPVAGYLVLAPGSDQARFVVVDSRAGQTLMLRTSLTSGPGEVADERDAQLRQMLETIVEESKSNITVVDTGDVAHERFSQVRRAVTGWKAYQETDETEETSLNEVTRSEEMLGSTIAEQELNQASRSYDDVQRLSPSATSSTKQPQSVSPSDITLSEAADPEPEEWLESRPASGMSDRARKAENRRRRAKSRSEASSISSAEEASDDIIRSEADVLSRPYY